MLPIKFRQVGFLGAYHYSGTSFGELMGVIQKIAKDGGRKAFIAAEVSSSDNFKEIFDCFRFLYSVCTPAELDQWCEAIEKEKVWERLLPEQNASSSEVSLLASRLVESQSSLPLNENEQSLLLGGVAERHKINTTHHSGASFGALVGAIKEIAKDGGREAFIAAKVPAAANVLAK